MSELLAFTIVGVVTGSIYAVAASGLVLTYTTSGVFNIAHGAVGMLMAFVYWQVRYDWGWSTPVSLAFVLLVAAPLLISHGWPAAVTSMASGAAVVLLSMVRGTAHDRFGGGWSAMWARDPYHVVRDAAGGPRVPGRSARA